MFKAILITFVVTLVCSGWIKKGISILWTKFMLWLKKRVGSTGEKTK